VPLYSNKTRSPPFLLFFLSENLPNSINNKSGA
jgi:hypothetical protein